MRFWDEVPARPNPRSEIPITLRAYSNRVCWNPPSSRDKRPVMRSSKLNAGQHAQHASVRAPWRSPQSVVAGERFRNLSFEPRRGSSSQILPFARPRALAACSSDEFVA